MVYKGMGMRMKSNPEAPKMVAKRLAVSVEEPYRKDLYKDFPKFLYLIWDRLSPPTGIRFFHPLRILRIRALRSACEARSLPGEDPSRVVGATRQSIASVTLSGIRPFRQELLVFGFSTIRKGRSRSNRMDQA
jgi:hypothetical protein